jgi:acylphosphatase
MTSRRVRVHGRVQAVGYRWFTRNVAETHHVTGWVRNRRDGTVEAELHGAAEDVDAVLAELRRGPEHARVDSIDVAAIDEATAVDFEFRPTI